MTHDELWQRMEWLGRMVAANVPADSAVARAFKLVEGTDAQVEDDHWMPDLATLNAAYRAFLALPAEVRRRIMGGWTYGRAYPSPAQVAAAWDELGGRAFRYRTLGTQNGRGYGQTEHELDGFMPRPVRVMIVEGTTQAQAVADLETALRMVREQWSDVVGPAEWIDEKSGSPEASHTPSLGSRTGEMKLAPTAA